MTSVVCVEVPGSPPPSSDTSPRAMRDFSIRAGDTVASAAKRERRLLLVGGRDDVARETSPASARVSAGRSSWTASPRRRAAAPSTADASLDADRTVSARAESSPRFHIRRARADLDDPSASPATPSRLRPHPPARLDDRRLLDTSATATSSPRPRRVDVVPVPASPTDRDAHHLPREDLDPATPAWLDGDATASPGLESWSSPSSSPSSSRAREPSRKAREPSRKAREPRALDADDPRGEPSADIVPRVSGGSRSARPSTRNRHSAKSSSFASRSRASRSARRPPDRLTFSAAMRAIETMEIRGGGASRRSRRARAMILGDVVDVRGSGFGIVDSESDGASSSDDDLVDARVARRRAETARRRRGFMRHTSAPVSAPAWAPPALTGVGHPPSHRVESDFARRAAGTEATASAEGRRERRIVCVTAGREGAGREGASREGASRLG